MPLLSSTGRAPAATSRTAEPSLLSRLTAGLTGGPRRSSRVAARKPVLYSRPRPAPVRHQKRRPSVGDKVSGALLKLRGSLTQRPGKKAAGTKRMRGTDGRGARRRAPAAKRRVL